MARPVVLVVGDEDEALGDIRSQLADCRYDVETVASGYGALDRILRDPIPEVVLLDMVMPEIDGLETLQRLRQLHPSIKVILLCPFPLDTQKVVEAMRLGAQDCLPKPCEQDVLASALSKCLSADSPVPGACGFAPAEEVGDGLFFVAASAAMHKIRGLIADVARIEVPVLCLGESGTGKEVVARMLHKLSSRAHRTFLKVNCAAVPTELLESELFGYEPGAFTGASRAKPGKFELCNKGTIFLDEIAEMSPALQAKLLHVLQDQEFARLGGCSKVKVDVRIIAATNVDIRTAIASKTFREDLYYRLNTVVFRIPPLRERREDIRALLRFYLARSAEHYGLAPRELSAETLRQCMAYDWPGNVRELENFAKRYLILGEEPLLQAELAGNESPGGPMVGPRVEAAGTSVGDLKMQVRRIKNEAETAVITEALQRTNWNRKEAARRLNISYKSLLTKIRDYGIGHHPETPRPVRLVS